MKHLFVLLRLMIVSVGVATHILAQNIPTSFSGPLPATLPPTISQVPPTNAARQSVALATTIRYVKVGGSGDGSSWNNASGDLQAMINASASGDQVWIAAGTYLPSTTGLADSRNAAFTLKNGVSVLGGFSGANGTEGNLSTRTAIPSSTTLSGGRNSYHVVSNDRNGIDNSAVLDGVVITAGNASGSEINGRGGGVFNWSASPTIINCQFVANSANEGGGGLYEQDNSSRIINCSFINNSATSTQSLGGGVEIFRNLTSFTNCFFTNNAANKGGGIYNGLSNNNALTNCTFVSNSAPNGAALYNDGSRSYVLINCLLWNNDGQNAIVGPATVSYSLLEADETSYTDGGNNQSLTSSPFANATGPELRLCSPAVDAGNDGVNSTATDVLGANRKVRTIDIGAAEFQGSSSPFSVTVQASPDAICESSVTTLRASLSGSVVVNGGYSYTFTAPLGATLSNFSEDRVTATANSAGVYSFSVSVSDPQGCRATNTVSLTVSPRPRTFNVTGSGSYCSNGLGREVGLSGSQTGVNYQLLRNGTDLDSPLPGTGNSLNFGPRPEGTYTVRATSPSCLQFMTGSAIVNVIQAPTASLTNNGPITCSSPMVSLSATGGDTYSFSPGASQVAGGNTATVTNEGTYTVTVSTNGCSATAITTVSSNTVAPQNVTLSSSGTLTCAQRSVNLLAGSATQGVSYSFTGPGVTAQSGSMATANQEGSYSVKVTGTNGCTATQTTQVQSNTTAPGASLTNNGPITCNQRSVTLTAGGEGTYAFSQGATANGSQATVTNEGPYSVTVTGANGCTATQTTTVSSNTTAPTATLGNNGPLTANQPTVTLNAGGGNTYQFSSGASQQGGGNTATVNSPGTYQVTVTGTNGCTAIASTVVTGAVSGSSCRNGTGVITVVASGTPVKYEWYRNSISSARLTENPAQVRGTSTASLTLVNQQVTADYYVRVTDQNGTAVVYGPFRFTVNTGCNIYARQGSEEVELRINLLGNPVQGEQLKATIQGAEGKALNVQLLDLQGRAIRQQSWQQAETNQSVEWSLSSQASGVYMLQATTPDQRHSVKVIKQ